ncbi:hypothetical protein HB662_06280 [Roseomonas frigidaquae]|uniref:Uncharacterized protein n=1 Tax=Falsiroseomonas frigidaquae TaxID=487318 RepID=A0ABX1EWM5_9PROT|nr:hypothetical protein [Falsiroseomonas frigidaquae]NKE44377.1 hypothetical protein [Falsiroseomonas frigidaquae]
MAILLLLLPLVAWLLWLWLGPTGRQPPRAVLVAIGVAVLLGAGVALWVRLSEENVTRGVYVPPSLGPDGRVLPSRLEPVP